MCIYMSVNISMCVRVFICVIGSSRIIMNNIGNSIVIIISGSIGVGGSVDGVCSNNVSRSINSVNGVDVDGGVCGVRGVVLEVVVIVK